MKFIKIANVTHGNDAEERQNTIYEIDTEEQRDAASEALRDAGLARAEVYAGTESACVTTGRWLYAAGSSIARDAHGRETRESLTDPEASTYAVRSAAEKYEP